MAGSKRTISHRVRMEVALRYGGKPGERVAVKCRFCSATGDVYIFPLTPRQTVGWAVFPGLELDHVVPESAGGPSNADNIVLSCRRCNRSRGTRPADSFVPNQASA